MTQEDLICPLSRIWEGLNNGAHLSLGLSSLPKIINIPDIHWGRKPLFMSSFEARFHLKRSEIRKQDASKAKKTHLLRLKVIQSAQNLQANLKLPFSKAQLSKYIC